jgi:hypothetical protein
MKVNYKKIFLAGTLLQILFLAASSTKAESPCVQEITYGAWVKDSCPSVDNSPSVYPVSYACAEQDDIPMPTVNKPTFSGGKKHRDISYKCPCPPATPPMADPCPATEEGTITYTVGDVVWDPDPKTFKLGVLESEKDFTSDCYVEVNTSDADLCPEGSPSLPFWVKVGTCSWHVVGNTFKHGSELDFAYILDPMTEIMKVAKTGCTIDPGAATKLSLEVETTKKCCSTGVGEKVKTTGTLALSAHGKCQTPNFPVPWLPTATVSFFIEATLSGNVSVQNVKECDQSGDFCIIPSASFTVNGGITANLIDPSVFSATGSISGGVTILGSYCKKDGVWTLTGNPTHSSPKDTYGKLYCVNDIVLSGTVTLVSMFNHTSSAVLRGGDCP